VFLHCSHVHPVSRYITVLNRSIDGFQSIFSLWQLEGKGSCDVDIDQSVGSMVMQCPPVPMVKYAMKSIYRQP